jgi:ribonuclease Z
MGFQKIISVEVEHCR